jgi:osmotically inducible protein OsmC
MAIAERTVATTVTLDEVDGTPTIISSRLRVRGRVPGLDASGFQEAVSEAAALCPVSRLFAGAKISVTATLDPAP